MNKTFWWLLLALAPFPLLGQEAIHTSTFTLGVGGLPYSYDSFREYGGPTFTGRYEYRLWKYLAVESGVDTLLPSTPHVEILPVISSGVTLNSYSNGICSACVFVSVRDTARITLVPFGLKGILPIADGRVELFGGLGGAYAWHSDYGRYQNALLGQVSLGGRIALEHGRRFWLGTTLQGYSNFGSGKQAWVPWTINLGIRFGR